jgi:hypothetical protein
VLSLKWENASSRPGGVDATSRNGREECMVGSCRCRTASQVVRAKVQIDLWRVARSVELSVDACVIDLSVADTDCQHA